MHYPSSLGLDDIRVNTILPKSQYTNGAPYSSVMCESNLSNEELAPKRHRGWNCMWLSLCSESSQHFQRRVVCSRFITYSIAGTTLPDTFFRKTSYVSRMNQCVLVPAKILDSPSWKIRKRERNHEEKKNCRENRVSKGFLQDWGRYALDAEKLYTGVRRTLRNSTDKDSSVEDKLCCFCCGTSICMDDEPSNRLLMPFDNSDVLPNSPSSICESHRPDKGLCHVLNSQKNPLTTSYDVMQLQGKRCETVLTELQKYIYWWASRPELWKEDDCTSEFRSTSPSNRVS